EGEKEGYSDYNSYAIDQATVYTTAFLRDGLDAMNKYLVSLVACADKAYEMGLRLNDKDWAEIDGMCSSLRSTYSSSAFAYYTTFENFLTTSMGRGMSESDIKAAGQVLVMYQKYCNYIGLDLDNNPSEKDLLQYMIENPAGHYEIVYRVFETADKATAEKLAAAKTVEEFVKLVIDVIMDENYTAAVLNQYAVRDAEKDEALLKNLKDDALKAKLAELGITSATYKSDTKDLDAALGEYIFNSKRANGNYDVIVGENSVYLVYVFEKINATSKEVKAGWKEYKMDAYETELEGVVDQLKKDLYDRKNSTDNKSAEDLAKDFIKKLKDKDNPASMPKDAITMNTEKPASNAGSNAVLDKLYENGANIKKGDILQADDDGTSYVIKVNTVDSATKKYNITYTTFEDSDYYALFRPLLATFEKACPKDAPTLEHPEIEEADEKDEDEKKEPTMNEWLIESVFTKAEGDTPAKREFKRATNDIKLFTEKTTDSTTKKEKTTYKTCIVVTPMELSKDETDTVYGGYLLFDSKEEADAAKATLNGLKGFDLWNTFAALTSVTKGKDDKETTNNAKVENALTKEDITNADLEGWLFHADRKEGDVEVVKCADGYYLAYFFSAEKQYLRDAKNEWVSDELSDIVDKLVADGGYVVNADALNAIGQPTETETKADEEETTAATK
ncbi:MAG: hypothetical protein IJX13_04300, partial [Clostridia bacterium]|nr:hypothetical protein [Clostridia bacterium]